jgi:hypothetical protein
MLIVGRDLKSEPQSIEAPSTQAILCAQSNPAPQDHWVATCATSEEMAVTSPDRPILAPNIKMPDFAHMKGVHGPPPLTMLASNRRCG